MMRDGLLPDPSLLQVMREILAMQNVRELQSFLSLVSYYSKYVKWFAAIAPPLHALTKKGAVFSLDSGVPECPRTVEASIDHGIHYGISRLLSAISVLY